MKKHLLILALTFVGTLAALAAKPAQTDSVWIENKEVTYKKGAIDIHISLPQLDSKSATEKIVTSVNQDVIDVLTANCPVPYPTKVENIADLRLHVDAVAQELNKRKEPNAKDPIPYQFFSSWSASGNNLLLSVLMKTYVFKGGAHGMTRGVYLNYNSQTGERIDLQSYIADTAKFMDMAAVYFCKERRLPADVMQLNTGLFMQLSDLPMPKQLGFNTKGLVLYYDQYEIAPYSSGVITITIPYKEIDHVMSKEISKAQLVSGGTREFNANTKRVNTALWKR
ncbi:MAG: DUF3298 domain-containing protein [Mucinivorans sp.]